MRRIFFLAVFLFWVSPVITQESTIAEIMAERSELSQFYEILQIADPSLLEQLAEADKDFTLFAPTNQAFEQLAADLGTPDSWQALTLESESFEAILENSELLTQIVTFHILDNRLIWDDVLQNIRNGEYSRYLTLNKSPITITGSVTSTGEVYLETGVYILESNPAYIDLETLEIEASNGLIYLLDYPLLPEIRTIGEIITEDASYGEEEGDFLRLLELINAADPAIMEMLNDPDANLTLFAPYDDVFEDFEDFEALLGDTEAATAWLNRYIIPERIYGFSFMESQEVETLSGEMLNFLPDETADYGEFFVNEAYVVFPDRTALNGVIHEIETLLD